MSDIENQIEIVTEQPLVEIEQGFSIASESNAVILSGLEVTTESTPNQEIVINYGGVDYSKFNQEIDSLQSDILTVKNDLWSLNDDFLNQTVIVSGVVTDLNVANGQITAHTQNLDELLTRTATHDGHLNLLDLQIESTGQSITVLEQGVNNLNDSVVGINGAMNSLSSEIDLNRDGITLQSNSITDLYGQINSTNNSLTVEATAREELSTLVGNLGTDMFAIANRTTSLSAAYGTTANLLGNCEFAANAIGWWINPATGAFLNTILEPDGAGFASELPDFIHSLWVVSQAGAVGDYARIQAQAVPVRPGKWYGISAYTGGHNTVTRIYFEYLTADQVTVTASGFLPASTMDGMEGPTPQLLSSYERLWLNTVAPEDAAVLKIWWYIDQDVAGDTWSYLFRPMVENSWESQEEPSEWVNNVGESLKATADALQVLEASVVTNGENMLLKSEFQTWLNTDYTDLDTEVQAHAQNISDNTSLITLVEGELTALSTTVTKLTAEVGGLFDSGVTWNFDAANEGWAGTSGGYAQAINGHLRPPNVTNDVYVVSPLLTIDGSKYRSVRFRVRKIGAHVGTWNGVLLWTTYTDTVEGTNGKTIGFQEPVWNASTDVAEVQIDNIPWGTDLRTIRIHLYENDPQTASSYIEYDWIAIGRPAPGASTAMLTSEATARANEDSALATRIDTADATLAGKADSTTVQAISNTVTQQGDTLTTHGNQITSLNNTIVNKADSSAVSALDSRVTSVEGVNTSQGTALTQVQARIGVRPNLLKNPSFQNGMTGWGSSGVVFNASNAIWGPTASWAGAAYTGTATLESAKQPIVPNEWYTVSADALNIGASDTYAYVDMQFLDAGGNVVLDGANAGYTGSIDFDVTEARRNTFSTESQAPSNATDLVVRIVFYAKSAVALGARRVKLERGRLPSTIYSEDGFGAAGAEATTALTSTVTQQGNTISSQGGQITNLQNTVANKAESSALNAMDSRVTTAEGTITSHSGSITNLQNTVANKADSSALNALSSTVTQQGNTINAQGTSLTQVRASLGSNPNLLPNGGFENGRWTNGEYGQFHVTDGFWGRTMEHSAPWEINGGGHSVNSLLVSNIGSGVTYVLSCDTVLFANTGSVRVDAWIMDSSGNMISAPSSPSWGASHDFADGYDRRQARSFQFTTPSNAAKIYVRFVWEGVTGCSALGIRQVKLEKGVLPSTPYSSEALQAEQASVTQTLTARTTTNENNISSALAQYFLAVQAGNLVGGMKIGNNGSVVDFAILANIFRIVDPNNSANLLSYTNGNLNVSGMVTGSLLQASAMEMGSTRIHTGGGRLAPFTIKDSKYYVTPGSNTSKELTLDGFISPTSYSGYNHKRFAAYRSDVWLDAQIQGDTGVETAIIEVSYDGGGWQQIISISFDCNYRGGFPIMVRYTTVDSWGTVSFRLRTTQNRTEAMRFTVDIANYNASGNDAGSNSGGSGGGSAPPPTGGGGGEFCVDYETTVLPDGRYVRDLQVGDLVECVDVLTDDRYMFPLQFMAIGYEDCYKVITRHGEVIQSVSTPMNMRDGSIKRTPELYGEELLTYTNGWEVAKIEYVGMRKVCKPDFGDRMFFAGTDISKTIATHNVIMKP